MHTSIHLNDKQKARLGWLLSFLLPAFITVLALTALRITPFGDKTLMISDAKNYVNGLAYFGRLLRGQEGFLYSFRNGLGGNELSTAAWGGLNPLFAIFVFGGPEVYPAMFTWLAVLNVSVSGVTMYALLNAVRRGKSGSLIFSTSYAMCGFVVANVYQTGFYTGVHMLPLVILGLYRLFQGRRPWLYTISLGYACLTNFYFGYMLCAASVVYFLAYLCANAPALAGRKGRLFAHYAVSSLLAGLLGAVIWLPTLKAYTGGGRIDQTGLAEYTFVENMPFIQMFSKLFSGANSLSELVHGLPNIFCGILVVALAILFFMNKKIDRRRRIAAAAVLTFYLLTFYIRTFMLVMHGFTHTNWFWYRYSFVFSFFLVMLAAEQFSYFEETPVSDTKRAGVIILIAVLLVFSVQYEFVTGGAVLLDLLILFVMWLVFILRRNAPERAPAHLVPIAFMLLVGINLYANFVISTNSVMEWAQDLEEYNAAVMTSGSMTEAVAVADNGFYRLENENALSGQIGADPALYGYNGVGHSGPAERMFIHQELSRYGVNWFDMRHWYGEGIPSAADSLLGVKYLLSQRDLTEEKGYDQRVTLEDTTLYQNPRVLPIAVNADAETAAVELTDDAFENLNAVWRAMTGGSDDVFHEEEDVTFTLLNDTAVRTATAKELEEHFSAQDAGETMPDTDYACIEVSFTAGHTGPYYLFNTAVPASDNGVSDYAMRYMGTYEAGDDVRYTIRLSQDYLTGEAFRIFCSFLRVACEDAETLRGCSEILQSRDITLTKEKETLLTGTVDADRDGCILFTIPWDEGWSCTVDGAPVPVEKSCGLFMTVPVSAGSHTYELRFFPALLDIGIAVSAAALLCFLVYLALYKKLRPPVSAAEAEPGRGGHEPSEDLSAQTEAPVDTDGAETASEAEDAATAPEDPAAEDARGEAKEAES